MSQELFRRAEEVFFVVRGLSGSARAEAVAKACGDDTALRTEVESLISAAAETADFLATPALGGSIAAASDLLEEDLSGEVVGAWALERRLGTGGMGAVYLGRRADGAFDQRVAVKVVKRGMDTDEILRRFRAERQTLAGLNHPNIARILDGGATPAGRPFLVMELVDGQPIDEYCDTRRLDVPGRVRLFRAVCEAVRAAHQALVIHRDLKPSNILVDGSGRPKLLDFGIARVLNAADQTATLTTADQRAMTPAYASPEQVRGEAVGTPSDVYSLGLILYQLLSGRRPYEITGVSRSAIEAAVCYSTPALPSVAALAGDAMTGARRAKALRGDLDLVVMTAIRKEPARRYASVDALIADLDSVLSERPVAARPDTMLYRVSKFVRRNPAATLAAACAVVALLSGVAATTWQWREAMRERDEAFRARDEAEAMADFLRSAFAAADPESQGPEAKVRSFVDAAARDAPQEFKDRPLMLAKMMDSYGRAYVRLGEIGIAERVLTEAMRTREAMLPPQHHDLAESHQSMGELRFAQRRLDDAIKHLEAARAIFEVVRGADNRDTAEVWNNIGVVHRAARRLPEAAAAHQRARAIREATFGAKHLKVAESLNNLAAVHMEMGDLDLARTELTRSIEIRREQLRADHPMVLQSLGNLAALYATRTEFDDAERILREVVALGPGAFGADSLAHAVNLNTLGGVLFRLNRVAEAEPVYREALRIRRARLEGSHPQVRSTQISLGRTLLRLRGTPWESQDKLSEGESLVAEGVRAAVNADGRIEARLRDAVMDLVGHLNATGREVDAQRWLGAIAPQ